MNHFIGTLHCRCKVITLTLISLGNLTPALRAIVIDLTYTDYSNSSWEIRSGNLWRRVFEARYIYCDQFAVTQAEKMLDVACNYVI